MWCANYITESAYMTELKRKWLSFERWCGRNQHLFWLALLIAFFVVFPFFHTETIDFDAITAHLP